MSQNQWNPSLYQKKHSFVYEYGQDVLQLLGPHSGERILDIGCGTGQLTQTIAASGATVVGLDNAATMIESARENFPGIEFIVADASRFSFDEPFDAVFSNAALHWVRRANEAVQCINRALKSGGRFIAEFGGKGNVEGIAVAIRQTLKEQFDMETDHRWYFPSVGEYASLLEDHQFVVHQANWFARPTRLEGEDGMRNWILMFCEGMFAGLSQEAKDEALQRIEGRLRKTHYRDDSWVADYTRLRVVARKA
jgi:trans-aconitate 2-methyltransferase